MGPCLFVVITIAVLGLILVSSPPLYVRFASVVYGGTSKLTTRMYREEYDRSALPMIRTMWTETIWLEGYLYLRRRGEHLNVLHRSAFYHRSLVCVEDGGLKMGIEAPMSERAWVSTVRFKRAAFARGAPRS